MRITDNLYMLSGAAYGQVGNVYAIRTDKKLILIDSGKNAAALEVIRESLRYHRLNEYPVTHLLLTHKHQDHMGNARYFHDAGAEVICSRIDADGVENGGVGANDFGLEAFTPCKVQRRFDDGDVLELNGMAFTSLLVPGHTNGSAFFVFELDGKTMVATGDTVLPVPGVFDNGFDGSPGWLGSYELDKKRYIESLEKVMYIKADVLLGGHGIPVMNNGADIIRKTFVRLLREFR